MSFPAPMQLANQDPDAFTPSRPAPAQPMRESVVDAGPDRMAQLALRAAARAKQAGDQEAFQALMEEAAGHYREGSANAAVEGVGNVQLAREGLGRGMVNVGRHAQNLLATPQSGRGAGPAVGRPSGGMTDEALAEATELDQPLLNTGAGAAGNFAGEVATTAPMGGPLTGAAARVGGRAVAGQLAKPVVRGAFEGAAQGGLMGEPGEKMDAMIGGGALGTVLPAGMAAGSKIARGATRTPEADALLARGVDLTPGQMNPTGVVNQLEETATSLAGQGPMISAARGAARDQTAQAALRTGAAKGTDIPAGSAAEMLKAADASLKPLYDAAKGFPLVLSKTGKPVIVNQGANQDLATVFSSAVSKKQFSLKAKKEAQRFLENESSKSFKTTDDLIAMRSAIRAEKRAQRSTASPTQDTRAVAEMLEEAEQGVTRSIESQIPADAAASLRAGDQAYRQLAVLQDAADRGRGQSDALFTPSQLDAAVHSSMPEKTYTRMQPGQNELHDIAKAGRKTFETRAPATGARLLTMPGIPIARDDAALPLTLMAGTKAGRRIAQGQTAPQKMAQAMIDGMGNRLTRQQREALSAVIERSVVNAGVQNTRGQE